MKKLALFLITYFFISSLYGQINTYEPSGKRSIKTFKVAKYDKILIDDSSFNIILKNGKSGEIQVEADNAIHPIIKIFVEDSTLKMKAQGEGGVSLITTGKIYVTIPVSDEIEQIYLKWAGDISSTKEVRLQKMNIKMESVGDLDLQLNVDELELTMGIIKGGRMFLQSQNCQLYARSVQEVSFNGRIKNLDIEQCDSDLNFQNVRVENANLFTDGMGTMRLWVERTLKGSIIGFLTVSYRGNAKEEISVTKPAKVIKE